MVYLKIKGSSLPSCKLNFRTLNYGEERRGDGKAIMTEEENN